jgi:predicted N-formylglutamate amidohydrolase
MSEHALLLTCEHGGNRVPAAYRHLFAGAGAILQTHRGWDIGARRAARYLQDALDAPLVCATVTRLLVDLNRSIGHPQLFSSYTRDLAGSARQALLARHYLPYRELVAGWIGAALARGASVTHLSVHSFTPVLDGVRRRADVGLLYDPHRPREARFCERWQAQLQATAAGWTVRRNYPYRGTADGLMPVLRRRFSARRYRGVEIELNQAVLRADDARTLLRDLVGAMPRS